LIQTFLPPEVLAEARQRAAESAMTLSAYLREVGLQTPAVAVPVRWCIAGIEAMEAAGAELAHAIRSQDGRSRADIPACMRGLHAQIMALTIEEADGDLPPIPATFWRREAPPEDATPPHMRLAAFRCTPDEEEGMRQNAGIFGLPLSTYLRRRLQRRPLRPMTWPLEGMPAVRRAVGLLRHACSFEEAGQYASQLFEESDEKRWRLEEATDHDH